ncbi:hypothetical protein BZG29_16985 [Janthinobacterium sp. LM6]|nr:hypothetical protein BZG29_16985 [Janthinobacterium sp. LM6]
MERKLIREAGDIDDINFAYFHSRPSLGRIIDRYNTADLIKLKVILPLVKMGMNNAVLVAVYGKLLKTLL